MKKMMLLMIAVAFIATACGNSGYSQEDIDAIVAEAVSDAVAETEEPAEEPTPAPTTTSALDHYEEAATTFALIHYEMICSHQDFDEMVRIAPGYDPSDGSIAASMWVEFRAHLSPWERVLSDSYTQVEAALSNYNWPNGIQDDIDKVIPYAASLAEIYGTMSGLFDSEEFVSFYGSIEWPGTGVVDTAISKIRSQLGLPSGVDCITSESLFEGARERLEADV